MKKVNSILAFLLLAVLASCSIDRDGPSLEAEDGYTPVEKPCETKKEIVDVVIDFEELEVGYYSSNKGVSITTDNDKKQSLYVRGEDYDDTHFGPDKDNQIMYVTNASSNNYKNGGGSIILEFSSPTFFTSVDFLDSDYRTDSKVIVELWDGTKFEKGVEQKSKDQFSKETISFQTNNVRKVTVESKESFAIDNFRFEEEIVVDNCN